MSTDPWQILPRLMGVLIFLIGCGGPKPPETNGPTGTLEVKVRPMVPPIPSRFVPDTTKTIRVTARRGEDQPVTASGPPHTTISLTVRVGTYTVVVEALAEGEHPLAMATETGVEVRENETTSLTVALRPVDIEALAEHLLRAYTRLFLDSAHPLIPDRFTRYPDLASNDALLGYAIALLAAPRVGLLTSEEAQERAASLLDYLRNKIPKDASGVPVHFSRTDTGEAATGTEYSILTAAYTVLAAQLLAAEFPALKADADAYWDSIRWCDYLSPRGRFYFSRDAQGQLRDEAGFFTEEFLVVFAVARASRVSQPPASIWQTGLDYLPATYTSQAWGEIPIPAVTDDAAAFEVLLFNQFWDGTQAPAPIDVEANAVNTLLAHQAYVTEVLHLPVGLGRSPLYHRDDTYHLLGALPVGGTDRSQVEPTLVGTMAAAAALPLQRIDPRLQAAEALAWYVMIEGLSHPSGALLDSVRVDGEQVEPGIHLTAFNATLAIAGLFNYVFDNALHHLNPIDLNPPNQAVCDLPWPNGSVVIAARTGENEPTHLYRVDADGQTVLLDEGAPFSQPANPSFAPDGQDGWLYFDAEAGSRRFIWSMSADGRTRQLTSDPWGAGVDIRPLVSVRKKHLLFRTQRTGTWQPCLAEEGLTQGPGFGEPFPRPFPAAWSATYAERVWYRKDEATLAEYDVKAKDDTGQTVTVEVKAGSRPAVSPNGTLLAVLQPDGHVAAVNFAGQRQVEFPVKGGDPSWSGQATVVFADPDDPGAFYRGDLATGQAIRVPVQGLQITDLFAWPGSS